MDTCRAFCFQGATPSLATAHSAWKTIPGYSPIGSKVGHMTTFKCSGTELVEEAIIDGNRDIQVEFRAKIIDLEVSKRILDFPNNGEIVVRL